MLTRAKPDPVEKPKRFYKAAEAGEAEGAWGVFLDGRPARTPQGAPLWLPTWTAAELAVEEWAGQGEFIELATMTANRLAFTAIDRTPAVRAETAAEVARYAGSDLLCYFAEAPDALVERQARRWGPWLEWAEAELGFQLVRTAGVIHQPQPPQTVDRAAELAAELDDFRLTTLSWATALLGSAVLGFAVQRGRLSGEEAFELSRLDEAFQEERWGVDAEAAERTTRLRAEATLVGRWFQALSA